jgi:predicted amidohydrolase YtcJ
MLADLAVLDTPLSDECLKEIKGVRAKMTIVGGKIMWVGGLG